MSTLSCQDHQKNSKQRTPRQDTQLVVWEWPHKKGERVCQNWEHDEEHRLYRDRQHLPRTGNQTVSLHQDKEEVHLGVVCQTSQRISCWRGILQYQHGRPWLQTCSGQKCSLHLWIKRNFLFWLRDHNKAQEQRVWSFDCHIPDRHRAWLPLKEGSPKEEMLHEMTLIIDLIIDKMSIILQDQWQRTLVLIRKP